jgi:exopolysaccharide biosynthesis polyprenyl glycosylphosphotransferase
MQANAPLIQTREEEQAPLTIRRTDLSRRVLMLKRSFDFFAALFLILLFLPLWPVIVIMIKLTSPGPIVYCQKRVGKRRKAFLMYKFRSMIDNAHRMRPHLRKLNQAEGVFFKIKNDPRVTGVGKWLRRHSLDELPQLINVIKGEMSLVGPRPMPVEEVKDYADWHHQRHLVTPGLTGLWQTGGRSDLTFDQMIELDFLYIEKCSFWLDLKILFKTVSVVLRGKGAY